MPRGERTGFVLEMDAVLRCCEQCGYALLGAGLARSSPPPRAAFSHEEITTTSELSGSEAGDKQSWGGCDPRLAALRSKIKLGRRS